MQTYDLCLAWYWPYDCDFIRFIGEACAARGITLWQVTPANVLPAVTELYTGGANFKHLLDRATDDLRFEPIRRFAKDQHIHRINPAELSHWSEDKATMHLELIQAGLQTPYTVIISPFVDQPVLRQLDLTLLGTKFVLKPAVGGGGEGVVMNASSPEDIQRARMEFPDQKYLAQEQVQACWIAGREAWFRIFYVAGTCIPCWWNPVTHGYGILTSEEEQQFELLSLRSITEKIARVCKLDWFSTEVALTPDGRYVVVDYVNDGIDTRAQSKATDGVPDQVLQQIADSLVRVALM